MRKHIPGIASTAVVIGLSGLVAVACHRPRPHRPVTAHAQVHCPNGGNTGGVTPPALRIQVGDSIRWGMTGQVRSDSVNISLKSGQRKWPFAGGQPPHGDTAVVAAQAIDTGTYHYRIALWCRVGTTVQPDTIDPDIIIQ